MSLTRSETPVTKHQKLVTFTGVKQSTPNHTYRQPKREQQPQRPRPKKQHRQDPHPKATEAATNRPRKPEKKLLQHKCFSKMFQ